MYGWVVEVVAMVMMIRAFLFAPLFARGAASLTPTMEAYDSSVCSCVFVCVRAFAPYLPPLPACVGYERTYGCV